MFDMLIDISICLLICIYLYIYIYIQDPGPGALVPILSSMARQGHFSALWIWAKGCDMEFSRSSKFFSRFFHHKFEIP